MEADAAAAAVINITSPPLDESIHSSPVVFDIVCPGDPDATSPHESKELSVCGPEYKSLLTVPRGSQYALPSPLEALRRRQSRRQRRRLDVVERLYNERRDDEWTRSPRDGALSVVPPTASLSQRRRRSLRAAAHHRPDRPRRVCRVPLRLGGRNQHLLRRISPR